MSDYPPKFRRQLLELLRTEGRKKIAHGSLAKEANVSNRTVYRWTGALGRELAVQEQARTAAGSVTGSTTEPVAMSADPAEPPPAVLAGFKAHQEGRRVAQLVRELRVLLGGPSSGPVSDINTEKTLALLKELHSLDPECVQLLFDDLRTDVHFGLYLDETLEELQILPLAE